jgi:GNAT superfamily N-acetyltransferase
VRWRIVPFDPAAGTGHQAGVVSLISGIQRGEFGLPITPQDQPDLMDIPGFYVNGALGPGLFLVAIDGKGEVAGSIALLNIGKGQGALRKMFVRADMRGAGLAAALLDALLGWCRRGRAFWKSTLEPRTDSWPRTASTKNTALRA